VNGEGKKEVNMVENFIYLYKSNTLKPVEITLSRGEKDERECWNETNQHTQ
jgi:hypothetical protein